MFKDAILFWLIWDGFPTKLNGGERQSLETLYLARSIPRLVQYIPMLNY